MPTLDQKTVELLMDLNRLIDAIPLHERIKARGVYTPKSDATLQTLSLREPADVLKVLREYSKSRKEPQGHVVERALRLFFLIRSYGVAK